MKYTTSKCNFQPRRCFTFPRLENFDMVWFRNKDRRWPLSCQSATRLVHTDKLVQRSLVMWDSNPFPLHLNDAALWTLDGERLAPWADVPMPPHILRSGEYSLSPTCLYREQNNTRVASKSSGVCEGLRHNHLDGVTFNVHTFDNANDEV